MKCLQKLLGSIALSASSMLASCLPAISAVDTECKEGFFSYLKNVKSVQEYSVADFRYTLIHIRQKHESRLADIISQDFSNRDVIRVQEDIYGILGQMIERQNLKEVYSEAIGPEEIELSKKAAELEQKIMRIDGNYAFEKARLGGMEDPLSAAKSLAYDRVVTLRAAESNELNEAACEYFIEYLKNGRRGKLDEVHELRETFAIGAVYRGIKNSSAFGVLVYGGAHDFRNNIREWNEKNPDEKFSLVVVTPERYED